VRSLMVLVVAAGVFAAATSVVSAGSGPRLDGKFNVDATITENDFGAENGSETTDVFKFTSPCESGGCRKVKLDRKGGTANAHYNSTLHKESKGVYEGNEGPYPYSCPGSDDATFTAKHHIEVTRVRNGKAKKFRGTTKYKIQDCSFGTFVDYVLKGVFAN
jgi:hypothetical protein